MPDNPSFAYVANADSDDISVLKLDPAAKAWSVIQTVAVGGMAMPMSFSPDKRLLYVAIRTVPYRVVTLSVDAESGYLTPLAEAALVDSMAYISVDATGRWLFAASYPGSVVSLSPITPSGAVGETIQVVPGIQNAHSIRLDSSNSCLYACALGSDSVYCFDFDSVLGRIDTSNATINKVGVDSGPRHFAWNKGETCIYVLCELDGLIYRYHVAPDRKTFRLQQRSSTLANDFAGIPWAGDIHMSPDGRHLYASERRASTLSVFAVDPSTGELAFRQRVDTEPVPRGFAIDPSGAWLLAAGQDTGIVTCFNIDQEHGTLTEVAKVPVGRGPNWIEIVAYARA